MSVLTICGIIFKAYRPYEILFSKVSIWVMLVVGFSWINFVLGLWLDHHGVFPGTFVVFRILTMGWMIRWLIQHRNDLTNTAFNLAGFCEYRCFRKIRWIRKA